MIERQAAPPEGTRPPAPMVAVEELTAFHGTDLEDLCEATAEAINNGGGFGWVKTPKRAILESYWKGVLLVPERQLFVGRLDGTIAASCQLVRPPRNAESRQHQIELATTFVAPWARGHGLAKRVVAAAEAAARTAGVSIINLDLRETQVEAIKLFESLGFRRWGAHPVYAVVKGEEVAGAFYWKRLETPEPA